MSGLMRVLFRLEEKVLMNPASLYVYDNDGEDGIDEFRGTWMLSSITHTLNKII